MRFSNDGTFVKKDVPEKIERNDKGIKNKIETYIYRIFFRFFKYIQIFFPRHDIMDFVCLFCNEKNLNRIKYSIK